MGEALWPNGSQFLHLDVWRLGVSELGIYSALGVVGSGMKMMDVVYIPGEVQHSLQLRMQDWQSAILGTTPGSFITRKVPSCAER